MIERITTIRNRHVTEAELLIFLHFIRIKWHFLVAIYTVMEYEKIENISFI